MLGHDLSHTGQSPYPGPLSADDVKIWTGIDRVKNSPTIGTDGTIYVAVGWALCAIDPATMTTKTSWNGGACKRISGDVSASSVAIAIDADGTGETMIVGDRGNAINAIDTAGNLVWKYVHGTEGDAKASAAVGPDGTIYAAFTGNYDGIGVVTALDPADQRLDGKGPSKWHFTIGASVGASSPAYRNGRLYVGSMNGELHALVADDPGAGTRVWHTKLGTRINASPVIGPDGTIYVGSTSGFYAVDPDDGSIRWTFPTNGEVDQTAALSTGGTLYFGAKLGKLKTFYALTSDGHLSWKKEFPKVDSDRAAFPVIGSDGLVYAGIGNSIYVFGSGGTLLWSYKTNAPIMSFPAIGPLRNGRAVLYVPSGDHKVYAISSRRSGGGTNQPPTVDAGTNQSGDLGDVFTFTGSATDPDGDSLTYRWDFGDCPTHPAGCTDTGRTVTHGYAAEGLYTVTLTVSDGHGHTVSDTLAVSVGQTGGGTVFSDLFDRPNSTALGNGWVEAVHGLQISEGRACNDAGAGDHIAVQSALSGGDQSARAEFTSAGHAPGPRFGIVLRYQNSKNYYVLYRQAGQNISQLRIAKVVNGAETVLTHVPVLNPGLNVPFLLTGRVENQAGSANPTLTLTLNAGTKTVTVTDTSPPILATGVPGILLGAGTSETLLYCADNFFSPEDQ